MSAAAHHDRERLKDNLSHNGDRPIDHGFTDALRVRVDPAPNEGVEAADDSEDAVKHALRLEKFDHDHDEKNEAGETSKEAEDGEDRCHG